MRINMFKFYIDTYFITSTKPTLVHVFQFWFALIYLIVRTLAISLYAAEIDEQSQNPVEVMRAIPRASFCLEVNI